QGVKSIYRDALTRTSYGSNMRENIPAWLLEQAVKRTQQRLTSDEVLRADIPALLLYDALNKGVSGKSLYLNALNPVAQVIHMEKTTDLDELARGLSESPSQEIRSKALDRLMTTSRGRILALQVYVGSKKDAIRALVESKSDWVDLLSKDMQEVKDPVSLKVIQQAMEIMYNRPWGKPWMLDDRLKTFTPAELEHATDPRGKAVLSAEMEARAIREALDLMNEMIANSSSIFIQKASYTAEELSVVTYKIKSAADSQDVVAEVKSMGTSNDKVKEAIAKDIVDWKNKFLVKDQRISTIPLINKLILWGSGLFLSALAYLRLRKKTSLKKTSADDLILELRRVFLVDSIDVNGVIKGNSPSFKDAFLAAMPWGFSAVKKNDAVVNIPERGLFNGTRDYLQGWQDIVYGWKKGDVTPDAQDMVKGLNDILNNAFFVLRATPYAPELMDKGDQGILLNDRYRATFTYFNLLATDTLDILADLLEKTSIDPRQKELLSRDVRVLVEMNSYFIKYLVVLECRGVIDKVMGYKFPDNHWAERSGIYPSIRWFLLYTYLLKASRKKLLTELPGLLKKGNDLMPGLYGTGSDESLSAVVQESADALMRVVQRADNLTSPLSKEIGNKHKMRSFISRVRLMSVPVVLGIVLSMTFLGFGSVQIPLMAVWGVLVGFLIYWVPHTNTMQMPWRATMEAVVQKLDAQLRMQLGAADLDEGAVVRLALDEGAEDLERELTAQRSSVDMMMIIPEDPSYKGSLEEYARQRRGTIIRDDVAVEVMSPHRQGSGNVYFEALQLIRQRLKDPQFLQQNPTLAGRSAQDVRVLFIFHGNNKNQDDTILDWAIVNGYRSTAAMRAKEEAEGSDGQGAARGGHVIVYSRDVSFRPMPELTFDDVALWGDWVSQEELKTLGLFITNFTVEKKIEIREVLEKLNIPALQKDGEGDPIYRNKVLKYLEDHYKLAQDSLRQFPALTEGVVFSSRAVHVLESVLDQLENDPALWDKLKYLHMTTDILNNLLKSPEEIKDFVNKRINLPDIADQYNIADPDAARPLFKPFYNMFTKAKDELDGGLRFRPIIAYPGAAEVVHITVPDDTSRAKELLVLSPWKSLPVLSDRASNSKDVVKENGGLDLSMTSENIEFKEKVIPAMPGLPKIDSGRLLQFLQLFRGFDFSITAFQPLGDPRVFLGI
ncbi:MAG: hypothetical protein WCI27_03220, partial [Candidatus Omnitrophota bacterium]